MDGKRVTSDKSGKGEMYYAFLEELTGISTTISGFFESRLRLSIFHVHIAD